MAKSKRKRFNRFAIDNKIVRKLQELHECTENEAWFIHNMNMCNYPVMSN